MAQTAYGDISPRTAAHAAKRLEKRAMPYLCLEKFGQSRPLPSKSTKVQKFRRYERFPTTPAAITEGVTPSARQLSVTDITATLDQYGDRTQITDVVVDTHEDQVLNEAIDVLGEQAGQMIETVRFNVIKAGTNVYYGNGGARNAVNTVMTRALQRKIVRALKRQDARKITRVLTSTPDYGTEQVNAAFVAIAHPDCESDIRDMTGFVPSEKYGTMTPFEGEIGKVEEVRYLCSTIFTPWADAGGAKGTMISTTGTSADVYPILFLGMDAFGIVPFKGKNAVTPMVVNPKPSDSDPLGQRGHAAWKCYQTAVILNDAWMVRAEIACTD